MSREEATYIRALQNKREKGRGKRGEMKWERGRKASKWHEKLLQNYLSVECSCHRISFIYKLRRWSFFFPFLHHVSAILSPSSLLLALIYFIKLVSCLFFIITSIFFFFKFFLWAFEYFLVDSKSPSPFVTVVTVFQRRALVALTGSCLFSFIFFNSNELRIRVAIKAKPDREGVTANAQEAGNEILWWLQNEIRSRKN